MFFKKTMVTIVVALAVISIMAVAASATQSKPYGSYSTYLYDGSKAAAVITRCSCLPVDNYLAARVKMQYCINGNYYTTPWSNWDEGEDIASAGMAWGTSEGTSVYAWGEFKAQCSGGPKLTYSSTSN